MYWIDLLLFVSAIPLVAWLFYGFVDSVQRNDSRGLVIWSGIAGASGALVVLLVLVGWLSL